MKILHIWNTAGVGSIIAKYMDRLYGTHSNVVMRKLFDLGGISSFYHANVYDCISKFFVLRSLLKCLEPDIIHIHAFDKILFWIRLFSKKPIVLHYHGSDVRFRWKERKKYWSLANHIFYVTEEMKDQNTPDFAELLQNPVDTELFNNHHKTPQKNSAFHTSYYADDLAMEYALKHGLKLTIHNRQTKPIPYNIMPTVLSQYEYYIDVKKVSSQKGRTLGMGISKLGLEALACGLKVIRWDGKILNGLPRENTPEVVCRKVYETYVKLLS